MKFSFHFYVCNKCEGRGFICHKPEAEAFTCIMNVIKRKALNLDIPTISADVIQRWRDRGIEVSDHEGKFDSENIQVLIGADFANKFMHDKKEVEGEVAWRTSFGWVLSGVVRPGENAASDAKLEAVKRFDHILDIMYINVHYVQNMIETLWEMEEPLQRADHPILPMTFQNGRYQVGLLWKGHERPDDNRSQALAVTRNHLKHRLKDHTESRQRYDEVLLTEYTQPGAIKEDPDPDLPGYY